MYREVGTIIVLTLHSSLQIWYIYIYIFVSARFNQLVWIQSLTTTLLKRYEFLHILKHYHLIFHENWNLCTLDLICSSFYIQQHLSVSPFSRPCLLTSYLPTNYILHFKSFFIFNKLLVDNNLVDFGYHVSLLSNTFKLIGFPIFWTWWSLF